jgi:hypothetical protein
MRYTITLVVALLFRIAGGAMMLAAVLMWIFLPGTETDAPFRLIHLPGPETLWMVLRWLMIALIGGLGWMLWSVSGRRSR